VGALARRRRGIFLRDDLVRIAGSLEAGVFLSQLVYWQERATVERDGHTWVVQSYDDWCAEVHLSKDRLKRVLRELRDRRIIETGRWQLRGTPTLHVRLARLIVSGGRNRLVENPPMERCKSHQSNGANSTNPYLRRDYKRERPPAEATAWTHLEAAFAAYDLPLAARLADYQAEVQALVRAHPHRAGPGEPPGTRALEHLAHGFMAEHRRQEPGWRARFCRPDTLVKPEKARKYLRAYDLAVGHEGLAPPFRAGSATPARGARRAVAADPAPGPPPPPAPDPNQLELAWDGATLEQHARMELVRHSRAQPWRRANRR